MSPATPQPEADRPLVLHGKAQRLFVGHFPDASAHAVTVKLRDPTPSEKGQLTKLRKKLEDLAAQQ